MSLLQDLTALLEPLGYPLETGVFHGKAPDAYLVITPMTEEFEYFSDDSPGADIHEARISVYSKNNYEATKDLLVGALLQAGLLITQRQFIGYEPDTGYYHYSIDVKKHYYLSEV